MKQLIDDMESENMKKLYIESEEMISEVGRFITKKKLMIYGGFALNILLPPKSRFYKSFTVNDYDCFSKSAKNDAIELTEIFKKKGYKFIKIRSALHANTFKVYVDMKQILDITQMDPILYDELYKISDLEKKTDIYKHYTDKYRLAPFILLKSNMYFELARPNSSYFRWEKIYNRLVLMSILTKSIPHKSVEASTLKITKSLLYNIMKLIKDEKLPLIGNYALKKYGMRGYINYDENLLEVLSMDTKKTMEDIQGIIDEQDKYRCITKSDNVESPIKHKKRVICVRDTQKNVLFVINIVDINNECFSVVSRKGFEVCSIDACIYFLYRGLLANFIASNKLDFNDKLWATIACAENYTKVFNKDLTKRFSTRCYGESISLMDVLKDNWKKKRTIKYA